MVEKISKETQEKINQLQMMQQRLQLFVAQKQQFQLQFINTMFMTVENGFPVEIEFTEDQKVNRVMMTQGKSILKDIYLDISIITDSYQGVINLLPENLHILPPLIFFSLLIALYGIFVWIHCGLYVCAGCRAVRELWSRHF